MAIYVSQAGKTSDLTTVLVTAYAIFDLSLYRKQQQCVVSLPQACLSLQSHVE